MRGLDFFTLLMKWTKFGLGSRAKALVGVSGLCFGCVCVAQDYDPVHEKLVASRVESTRVFDRGSGGQVKVVWSVIGPAAAKPGMHVEYKCEITLENGGSDEPVIS